MGHRVGKSKKFSSRSKAKSHARNHGFQTPPPGGKSGPVSVRQMTPEELERYLQS